jgi:hypothetical protein
MITFQLLSYLVPLAPHVDRLIGSDLSLNVSLESESQSTVQCTQYPIYPIMIIIIMIDNPQSTQQNECEEKVV